jgi:hypothetical protein
VSVSGPKFRGRKGQAAHCVRSEGSFMTKRVVIGSSLSQDRVDRRSASATEKWGLQPQNFCHRQNASKSMREKRSLKHSKTMACAPLITMICQPCNRSSKAAPWRYPFMFETFANSPLLPQPRPLSCKLSSRMACQQINARLRETLCDLSCMVCLSGVGRSF